MEKTIRKCLDSLLRQDYPRDHYDVIVVDGGSTDNTQNIVRKYNVKMLIEKKKIRGYARNLGIKHAKGDIVAFIDADCSAGRRWLITHVKDHVNNHRIGAVGGAIKHSFYNASDVRARFSRPIVAMNAGEYFPSAPRRYILQIPTCNASFRKEIFNKVGLFDEKLHVGEDAEFCVRVLKNGYKILFDPEARVIHYDTYHFRELEGVQNYSLRMRLKLLMNMYSDGGKNHFQLQLKQRSSNYFMLPMSPFLILVLFPGLVGIRILRNLHKMRYVNPKMQLIKFFPYIILASISWVSGYFFESKISNVS